MPELIATPAQMEALGARIIQQLSTPAIVYLSGELGAGKTTLVRGALRSLGYQGLVKSPTFTLVESYSLPAYQIHHFDLYRISDPEELDFIGIREYASESSILFFEWPQKGQNFIPPPSITIELEHAGDARYATINT